MFKRTKYLMLVPHHKYTLRRRQLSEGYILFRYLTGVKPGIGLLRLYVRGLEKYSNGSALTFSGMVRRRPTTLFLWEPVSSDGVGVDSFQGRLQLALFIADASSYSGAPIYDYAGQGKVKAALRIFVAGMLEVIFMPFRLILGRGQK